MIRAAKSTAKLSVKAESRLHTAKSPSTKSMTVFRLKRENSRGITGPAPATTRANKLTKRPAWEMGTEKRSATAGRMPMTPISVFKMPNTPMAKIKRNKRRFFIDSPFCKQYKLGKDE